MQQPAPGVFYAGNGARFIAYLVDALIMGAIMMAVTVVLNVIAAAAASNGYTRLAGASVLFLLAIFLVYLVYMPWFWGHGGQTPGMKVFHLRVVRENDGGPVTMGQAFVRLIGFWVSIAVFYLGFIWILFDARRQGWHDKIAGTVVIAVP
ncbi:MAG TPA: RDD family protein [Candidatus Limnocylindrales bacterium]